MTDRSITAVIVRLRFGDSDGDDHDIAADEIERLRSRLAEAEDLEKDAMESFALIESAPARGFDVYYAVGMARGFIRRHSLLNASLSKGFSKGFSKDAPADSASGTIDAAMEGR